MPPRELLSVSKGCPKGAAYLIDSFPGSQDQRSEPEPQDCGADGLTGRGSGGAAGPEIVGLALPHEIAHLLLRSNAHSATGLMRAHWDEEDLRRARLGEFRFMRQEGEFLCAAALARSKRGKDVQIAAVACSLQILEMGIRKCKRYG